MSSAPTNPFRTATHGSADEDLHHLCDDAIARRLDATEALALAETLLSYDDIGTTPGVDVEAAHELAEWIEYEYAAGDEAEAEVAA